MSAWPSASAVSAGVWPFVERGTQVGPGRHEELDELVVAVLGGFVERRVAVLLSSR